MSFPLDSKQTQQLGLSAHAHSFHALAYSGQAPLEFATSVSLLGDTATQMRLCCFQCAV